MLLLWSEWGECEKDKLRLTIQDVETEKFFCNSNHNHISTDYFYYQ